MRREGDKEKEREERRAGKGTLALEVQRLRGRMRDPQGAPDKKVDVESIKYLSKAVVFNRECVQ